MMTDEIVKYIVILFIGFAIGVIFEKTVEIRWK